MHSDRPSALMVFHRETHVGLAQNLVRIAAVGSAAAVMSKPDSVLHLAWLVAAAVRADVSLASQGASAATRATKEVAAMVAMAASFMLNLVGWSLNARCKLWNETWDRFMMKLKALVFLIKYSAPVDVALA